MRRLLCHTVLVLFAAAAAACSGDDTSTPIEPTPVTQVTETFSGTLTINGAATHAFPTDGGTVAATLTVLAPDPLAIVGLSLGTWNGAACALSITNDNAFQGTIVIGSASQSGNLCVRIYDVGRLTAAASYQLTVVHP
jgi:hypothetical protein